MVEPQGEPCLIKQYSSIYTVITVFYKTIYKIQTTQAATFGNNLAKLLLNNLWGKI